jgi:hypothetical protein
VFGGETVNFGFLNEFFRFSTTALQWAQLDAQQVSRSPASARHSHGMAAVGSVLYVFGGRTVSGKSADLLVHGPPQVIVWPASGFSLTWFTRVYDEDIIQVTGDVNWSSLTVELDCLAVSTLPCSLAIAGDPFAPGTIWRHDGSRIVCEAASGCTGVTVRHVAVACKGEASVGPLQISGAGAVVTIESSTFSDCVSLEDGGSIRAYNGATVKISGSTFQRSSSQVFFMSMALAIP